MSDTIFIGLAGVGVLVVIQIILFAWGYGKLSEKVTGNYTRIDKIEVKMSDMEKALTKLEFQINRFSNNKDSS